MTVRQGVLLLICSGAVVALSACSNSYHSQTPPPPISIAFAATPPASLEVGMTATLTAVVTNDSASKGVAWSVSCASPTSGACGSFSLATSASGAATTYTAPLALPSSGSVTVIATSVADPTKSVSSPAIIITTPTITVTFSQTAFPPNAVQVAASAVIGANVTGDITNQGVSWSCLPAGMCGSFNPTTTPSGGTTTYTAPGLVPSGHNITVKASSVTNPGDSSSIPIFISSEPTTLADGTYVFFLAGTDTNGPYSLAGAFVVSNGAITTGEQDYTDSAVVKEDTIVSGSYHAVDDGNLWINLTTADTSVGVNGVETIDATLLSKSSARLIEFDSSATSSGWLDLQTSKDAVAHGYAFFATGEDSRRSTSAIGGVINVDGPSTISGAGSVFDLNDSGLAQPLTGQGFAASTVSAPDAYGRVVFSLVPASSSAVGQINLAGYIIDAGHIRLVETSDVYGGSMGGTALGQGANTGTFTDVSVSGSTYVVSTGGTDANGAVVAVGSLALGAGGSVSGTFSFNDIVQVNPPGGSALTASMSNFTVDLTGRVNLHTVVAGLYPYDVELYLSGDGHGVLISIDKTEVVAGPAYQRSGSLGVSSFSGSYAMNVAQILPPTGTESGENGTGPVVADGLGNFAGFADFNRISGTPGLGNNLSCSGSAAAGSNGVFSGTITGLNRLSPATPGNFTFYQVDATRVLFIESDSTQATLGEFRLQQ